MIVRMSHIGISVSDLEKAIEFYRTLFNMKVSLRRPFAGEMYERILALKGAFGNVALLKGPDVEIELFEFENPAPAHSDPNRPVCDHGITHFCVEVTNLDQEYARLVAAGVSFHCAPVEIPGVIKGTYGRDPDGNVFELIEILAHGNSISENNRSNAMS